MSTSYADYVVSPECTREIREALGLVEEESVPNPAVWSISTMTLLPDEDFLFCWSTFNPPQMPITEPADTGGAPARSRGDSDLTTAFHSAIAKLLALLNPKRPA